jgi:hypothetical protein
MSRRRSAGRATRAPKPAAASVAATTPSGEPDAKYLPIVAAPMPTNVYWHSETCPA